MKTNLQINQLPKWWKSLNIKWYKVRTIATKITGFKHQFYKLLLRWAPPTPSFKNGIVARWKRKLSFWKMFRFTNSVEPCSHTIIRSLIRTNFHHPINIYVGKTFSKWLNANAFVIKRHTVFLCFDQTCMQ